MSTPTTKICPNYCVIERTEGEEDSWVHSEFSVDCSYRVCPMCGTPLVVLEEAAAARLRRAR